MDQKAANHGELRMLLVMRGDLVEMPRGKSEVQATHAGFLSCVKLAQTHPDLLKAYLDHNQPKIGLEADDEAHLLEIVARAEKRGVPYVTITDAGRTIFGEPTLTCALIGPMTKTDSNAISRKVRMRDHKKEDTSDAAFWPAEDYVAGCSAKSIAASMIREGSLNADYPGDGEERSAEDDAFWERVRQNADRIASWAVQGLAITDKAHGADKSKVKP